VAEEGAQMERLLLDFAASNGLVPPYFPIPVFFRGDRHRAEMCPEIVGDATELFGINLKLLR
jgi:hypothetical protein